MSNGNTHTTMARLAGLHTSAHHAIISPSCSSLSRSLTFGSESDSLSLRQSVSKSSNYTIVEPIHSDTPCHPGDAPKGKPSKKEKKEKGSHEPESRNIKKRRKSRRILHLYTPSSRSPSRSPSPNLSGSESEGGLHPEKQYVDIIVIFPR